MNSKKLLNEINAAYYRLEMKQAEIIHALFHRIFEREDFTIKSI